MTTVFKTRGKPMSPSALEELQRQLGVELPEDYVQFMLEGDGARVIHPSEIAGKDFSSVREIFGWDDPDASYTFLAKAMRVYKDRVPACFLPVANDQAGNLFCLGIANGYEGKVYLWDHDLEAEEGEPPTFDNLQFVTASFRELIDRLTPQPQA